MEPTRKEKLAGDEESAGVLITSLLARRSGAENSFPLSSCARSDCSLLCATDFSWKRIFEFEFLKILFQFEFGIDVSNQFRPNSPTRKAYFVSLQLHVSFRRFAVALQRKEIIVR
jgi:hypothetical protein